MAHLPHDLKLPEWWQCLKEEDKETLAAFASRRSEDIVTYGMMSLTTYSEVVGTLFEFASLFYQAIQKGKEGGKMSEFRVIHPDFKVDFESALGLDMDLVDLHALVGDWDNPSHLIFNLNGQLLIAPFVDFKVQYQALSEGEEGFPTGKVMSVWFVYCGADAHIMEQARRQRESDLKK